MQSPGTILGIWAGNVQWLHCPWLLARWWVGPPQLLPECTALSSMHELIQVQNKRDLQYYRSAGGAALETKQPYTMYLRCVASSVALYSDKGYSYCINTAPAVVAPPCLAPIMALQQRQKVIDTASCVTGQLTSLFQEQSCNVAAVARLTRQRLSMLTFWSSHGPSTPVNHTLPRRAASGVFPKRTDTWMRARYPAKYGNSYACLGVFKPSGTC